MDMAGCTLDLSSLRQFVSSQSARAHHKYIAMLLAERELKQHRISIQQLLCLLRIQRLGLSQSCIDWTVGTNSSFYFPILRLEIINLFLGGGQLFSCMLLLTQHAYAKLRFGSDGVLQ